MLSQWKPNLPFSWLKLQIGQINRSSEKGIFLLNLVFQNLSVKISKTQIKVSWHILQWWMWNAFIFIKRLWKTLFLHNNEWMIKLQKNKHTFRKTSSDFYKYKKKKLYKNNFLQLNYFSYRSWLTSKIYNKKSLHKYRIQINNENRKKRMNTFADNLWIF